METDFDKLLEKAKDGKISKQEVDWVAQQIHEKYNDDSLYTLIYILGKAEAKQYKSLVEKFLYYPSDPMISKIALQTLCNFWDFTEEYLDDVKSFVRGVDWDEDEDVRMIAISAAGQFLKTSFDKELLQLLINVFENNHQDESIKDSKDNLIQGCAYEAILRAMGKNYNEIPRFLTIEKLLKTGQLDLSMVQKAKSLVA